jgi:hypothetical protein
MQVADQTFSIELANFHASVLRQFRSLNPNMNMSSVMRPWFSESFTVFNQASTPNRLGWAIGGDQTRKIIYIDGCEFPSHASNLVNGYDTPAGVGGLSGFNTWLRDNAEGILLHTEGPTVFQPEYLDVVGYSAGGAVGHHIVRILKQRNSLKKLRIITFGAPRAMNATDLATQANVPTTRWMNDNDPIPLVPPRLEDAPILIPLLGLVTALRWASYVHSHGGLSIDADGLPTDADVPALASMSPGTSLASWLFGQENDPLNPHALTSYQSRFQKVINAPNRNPIPVDHGGGTEPPANATRRVHNRSEAAVVNQIQQASERQNAVESSVAPSVLFKAVKLGKVWSVSFGDNVIVYAGNRKRAFHLARAGNDFLRSMPKQAFVDPKGIVDQMTAFFDAAIVPGGPVNPPISISL